MNADECISATGVHALMTRNENVTSHFIINQSVVCCCAVRFFTQLKCCSCCSPVMQPDFAAVLVEITANQQGGRGHPQINR